MEERIQERGEWEFSRLGFLFYDLTHILLAVVLIPYFAVTWHSSSDKMIPGEGVIAESLSLLCSLILIAFLRLYKGGNEGEKEHPAFSFAWTLVGLSLFLPALIDLIFFFLRYPDEYPFSFAPIMKYITLALLGIGLVLSLVSLGLVKSQKPWKTLIFLAIGFYVIALLPFVVGSVVVSAGEATAMHWAEVLDLIGFFAVLFPAFFAFRDFLMRKI